MSLLRYYSGQCMIRVKECSIRMGSWETLKYLGISLGKIHTTAASLVLLQTFTSPSGAIWCSSCCGKRRLRLCNESVRAMVQHKANCCLSAGDWATEAISLQGEATTCWKGGKDRGPLEEEKLNCTVLLNCNLLRTCKYRVLSRKSPNFLVFSLNIIWTEM